VTQANTATSELTQYCVLTT